MNIKITVSDDELNEMGMDEHDLVEHIIETLEGDLVELVDYNVILIKG